MGKWKKQRLQIWDLAYVQKTGFCRGCELYTDNGVRKSYMIKRVRKVHYGIWLYFFVLNGIWLVFKRWRAMVANTAIPPVDESAWVGNQKIVVKEVKEFQFHTVKLSSSGLWWFAVSHWRWGRWRVWFCSGSKNWNSLGCLRRNRFDYRGHDWDTDRLLNLLRLSLVVLWRINNRSQASMNIFCADHVSNQQKSLTATTSSFNVLILSFKPLNVTNGNHHSRSRAGYRHGWPIGASFNDGCIQVGDSLDGSGSQQIIDCVSKLSSSAATWLFAFPVFQYVSCKGGCRGEEKVICKRWEMNQTTTKNYRECLDAHVW